MVQVRRRFVIRDAEGLRIGEGLEQVDRQIVARLPLEWSGAHLGDLSQWEDIEVALLVIQGLGFQLEWVGQHGAQSSQAWRWEHTLSSSTPPLRDFRQSEDPSEAAANTGTTRFTEAMYLDEDGQQRSVVARGWVGMVQPFIDAGVDASLILGQMYFERPGRDAPLEMDAFLRQLICQGVAEITVVDLRSNDGEQRMCQEYYGRFTDPERIGNMVASRLGPEMSDWTIVNAHVLRIPGA